MLTTETTQAAVMFLISIGTLAANELKERWTLMRKKKNGTLDLTDQDQSENDVATAVNELLAGRTEIEVKRTLELVQRRRKLIFDAQREKLFAEEEFNEGRINSSQLQLIRERCDQQIRDKFQEIESDLKGLGLQIEKPR
ncbi:MAG: hypothetical protein R3E39_30630 [Anaerolineae bacterium]